MSRSGAGEPTYPLGAVCRITGLGPDVIRAWERRYGAVTPLRTPKGTRRYRASDVSRLQLLGAAVGAGHRIGDVFRLADTQLAQLIAPPREARPTPAALARALAAIEVLDVAGTDQVVAEQLGALGAARFAREFAVPLLRAIGEHWSRGELCVAAEHMASALLRSLLGAALRPTAARGGPRILFCTPEGERHELGLLVSALVAAEAGASPLFLGAELPAPEVATAVELSSARAVVVALTTATPHGPAARGLAALRKRLPSSVEVWVGGNVGELRTPEGVLALADLDDLDRQVRRLVEQPKVAAVRPARGRTAARPRRQRPA